MKTKAYWTRKMYITVSLANSVLTSFSSLIGQPEKLNANKLKAGATVTVCCTLVDKLISLACMYTERHKLAELNNIVEQ